MKPQLIVLMSILFVINVLANDQIREIKLNIEQLNIKQIKTVAAQPRVSLETDAYWVDTSWVFSTRNRFEYLDNGNISQEFEDTFGFSGWSDYNRYNYAYDQNDLLQTILGETFNVSQWDTLDRRTHDYYPDGKLMHLTREVYTFTGWFATQRESYEYNEDGLVSKQYILQPTFFGDEVIWENNYLFESTYTAEGLISELVAYTWSFADTTWYLSYKLTSTYDVNGIEEEVVFSVWTGDWVPSTRTVNTITDSKIVEIKYQSDYGSGWLDTDRDFLEYDANNNLASKYSQQYYNSVWRNTYRTTYEYDPASGIDLRSNGTIAAQYQLYDNYPNPFNPETIIKFALPVSGYVNLQVYNILGQSVATLIDQDLNSGEYTAQFNAGNLPSGVYFYRLQAESFQMTKRMVLLR